MRNLKMTIAYDGTGYCGWQMQPNGVTIQGELEGAIRRFTAGGQPVSVTGSGRTDAGVHAWGQVANWFYEGCLPVERIQAALNSLLPEAITIRQLEEVDTAFHARKTARAKTYLYVIDNTSFANPFLRRFSWHLRRHLDLEALCLGAGYLVGEHDFLSFKAADGETATSRRTIFQVRWLKRGGCLCFIIRGSGFLKNMVRIIVGTLVEIGSGKLPPEAMAEIITARDRGAAGMTAPARGLTLRSVEY
jgi:tRNA pseudouridine38-40 synthase